METVPIAQFKIRPERLNELKKQMFIKVVPLVFLTFTGVLCINYFTNTQPMNVDAFIFSASVFLIAMVYGINKGAKRQIKLLEHYTLFISDQEIRREQNNTPLLTIPTSEIFTILKNRNGSFSIIGKMTKTAGLKYTTNVINVPAQIENYNQIEKLLQNIRPFTKPFGGVLLQVLLPILTIILTIGLMAIVYITKNKIMVAVSGVLFVALSSWSFLTTYKSKNVDNKTKKLLLLFVLPIISVIYIAFLKLN